MTIQFPKKAKEIITSPIPRDLIKTKPGKAAADYISGSTVTDYLNQAFGYLWSFEVNRAWVEEGVAKFNPKYDKEPVPQGPVAHVQGRLTVFIPNEDGTMFQISKEQFGSKAVIGGQMDQEHIFKSAGTDALKKCASLFGIGLELYRDDNEQAYFDDMNYESPWSDEAREKHATDLAKIKEFMSTYDLDVVGMVPYLQAAFGDEFNDFAYIVPENIVEFVSYLESVASED